jgi:C_GCAxxG_C_C family probable redox protein
MNPEESTLSKQIEAKVHNLFVTRQLYCSEAVLVTLNESFGGGLSRSQAVALAAPFAEGQGRSGCLCGAIGGGLLALGLFLAQPGPYRKRRQVQAAAAELNSLFSARYGATCCRVITRKLERYSEAHMTHCAEITATTAALTAGLILSRRPSLAGCADTCFLNRHATVWTAFLKRLGRKFVSR